MAKDEKNRRLREEGETAAAFKPPFEEIKAPPIVIPKNETNPIKANLAQIVQKCHKKHEGEVVAQFYCILERVYLCEDCYEAH
jgi:hypothetical protein